MEGQVAFEFSLIGMSMMVMMTALILEREDHRAREGAKEERGRIIARREGGDELDHHTTTASDDALLAVGRAWDINLHSLSGSSCGHHCRDMALLDCTTIVTDAADMDDGEFDSAPPAEGTDGEDNDYRDHDDDDEILNCNDEDDDDRVPAEVKVSFWNLSDNDDSMTRRDRTGHEKGKCVAAAIAQECRPDLLLIPGRVHCREHERTVVDLQGEESEDVLSVRNSDAMWRKSSCVEDGSRHSKFSHFIFIISPRHGSVEASRVRGCPESKAL